MKRFGIMAALLAAILLPSFAHAICTAVSVTVGTSTQVLAANDQGSNGRNQLWITGGSSCPAYCDVGATAVAFNGFPVFPGQTVPIAAAQQAGKTYPITPNGAVNCIVPANMGCQAQTVSACDN